MITRLKILLRIIKKVKNWPSALLIKLGLKLNSTILFKNGDVFALNKENWSKFVSRVNFFNTFPNAVIQDNRVTIKYKSRDFLTLNPGYGEEGLNTICEIFGIRSYRKFLNEFPVKNKDVVDIGASIGDSPIYFALEGARKVYGFEALPSFYALAEENIKRNKLDDVCKIINSVVGGSPGYSIIDPALKQMFGINFADMQDGQKVKKTTLEEIVNEFNLNRAFLKIDCEGYEYEIVLSASDAVLKSFDVILIEYHYGFNTLEEKLRSAGFSVRHTPPKHHYFKNFGISGSMNVGFIIAFRKNFNPSI